MNSCHVLHFLYFTEPTGIELGYTNVYQDTINGETVLESGAVPTWLSGKRICRFHVDLFLLLDVGFVAFFSNG